MQSSDLWEWYDGFLTEVGRRDGAKAVAELGGGANPILAADAWSFASERAVFDISAEELAKAEGINIDKRVADLCQAISDGHESYDLVFSKMLCEHLPDARMFHQNCFNLLRPGGLAVHFFPTLFAAPFVINRLLPEQVGRSILSVVRPSRINDPKHGKFPAYYRWCVGPTTRSLRRFESVGFEVESWRGGYGHGYYGRIPLLDVLEKAKSRFLVNHPRPALTSFGVVLLRKPLT